MNNILFDKLQDNENSEQFLKQINTFLQLEDDQFNQLKDIILDNIKKNFYDTSNLILIKESLKTDELTIDEIKYILNQNISSIQNSSLSDSKKEFLIQVYNILIESLHRITNTEDNSIIIPIEIIDNNKEVKIPKYAHLDDSGMDIYTLEEYDIAPGETVLIKTGLKMQIPDGFEIQVRPKSGISLKTKLRIANAPGTIKVA